MIVYVFEFYILENIIVQEYKEEETPSKKFILLIKSITFLDENKAILEGKIYHIQHEKPQLFKYRTCKMNISISSVKQTLEVHHLDEIINSFVSLNGYILPLQKKSNPGQIDPILYSLGAKSLGKLIPTSQLYMVKEQSLQMRMVSPVLWVENHLQVQRDHMLIQLNKLYSQPTQGIVAAMLLGVNSDLTDEIRSLYTEQGISHIIAISGLHIGFLCMAVNGLTTCIIREQKKKLVLVGGFIGVYNIFIGFNVSAIRASVMAIIYLASIALKKPYDAMRSLQFTFILCVMLFPESFFRCGFLLSYGAVLGIILLQPLFKGLFRPFSQHMIIQTILDSVSISISVNVMTIPIVLFFFGGISLTSIITNALIVPVVIFIYLGALITLCFSYLFFEIGIFMAGTITIFSSFIEGVCRVMSYIPLHYIYVKRPSLMEVILYYGLAFIIIRNLRRRYNHRSID